MIQRLFSVWVVICLLAGGLRDAVAETGPHPDAQRFPPLDELIEKSELIVHCRAEANGRVVYRVLEAWKGEYAAGAIVEYGFRSPGAAGQEWILFYSGDRSRKEFRFHDMALPVRDGKVSYLMHRTIQSIPPTPPDFNPYQEFTLEEFKRRITAPAAKPPTAAPAAATRGPARAAGDLSGRWRLYLPGGFERKVTLETQEAGLYRLECDAPKFNGSYEVREKRLVGVESDRPDREGFEWQIRTPYLLTLVRQPEKAGGNYLGSVLFRLRQDADNPVPDQPVEDRSALDPERRPTREELRRMTHFSAEGLRQYEQTAPIQVARAWLAQHGIDPIGYALDEARASSYCPPQPTVYDWFVEFPSRTGGDSLLVAVTNQKQAWRLDPQTLGRIATEATGSE